MSIKRLSGAGLTTPKSNKLWDQTTFQSGMFALATITLTSSQSSVVFDSIPSGYTHLQIRGIARDARTSTWVDTLWMYCNADVTGANYYSHILYGNGSAGGAASDVGQNSLGMAVAVTGATSVTTSFAPFVIDILDYASTNKNKTVRSLHGLDDNTNGTIRLRSGLWMSTAAITTLTLKGDSGNLTQYSSFALYGIKSA